MIVVDRDKCTGCGLCVKICHEHGVVLADGWPSINSDVCSTCAQCIAVCPQRGLSWDQVPPTAFDRAQLPSPEQLDELFRERRSMRFFKKDKIDRVLLEEIVGRAIYAPTENFHLRAIVADDAVIIAELEEALMAITRTLYKYLSPRFLVLLARPLGFAHTYLRTMAKLEATVERGHVFSSPPAAYVFIVGDKRIPLSDASAQYALANVMYYAQARGLGCGLCGNGQLFFDKNRTVRKRLGLHKRENILGTLMIGYPEVRFANAVNGKAVPIQWNSGQQAQANGAAA
jgi:nitroreductase